MTTSRFCFNVEGCNFFLEGRKSILGPCGVAGRAVFNPFYYFNNRRIEWSNFKIKLSPERSDDIHTRSFRRFHKGRRVYRKRNILTTERNKNICWFQARSYCYFLVMRVNGKRHLLKPLRISRVCLVTFEVLFLPRNVMFEYLLPPF